MSQPVIEFYKLRDFGAKMNATIEFLRENIGRLFLNLLFIAGPVALLMSLLMTLSAVVPRSRMCIIGYLE